MLSLVEITAYLKERLDRPLPGPLAHELMRAQPTGNLRPVFKDENPPRPGGVLILLYEVNGVVKFPLIKRPDYPGIHGGQISLPGGKAELGEDRLTAALREGEEEIGIKREYVKVIGKLTDFHVIPSHYLVTPVVGVLESEPIFVPDPVEVAKIISVTIEDLINEEAPLRGEIIARGGYKLIAPHFIIEDEMVWGATAMILNEFRHILSEIGN